MFSTAATMSKLLERSWIDFMSAPSPIRTQLGLLLRHINMPMGSAASAVRLLNGSSETQSTVVEEIIF